MSSATYTSQSMIVFCAGLRKDRRVTKTNSLVVVVFSQDTAHDSFIRQKIGKAKLSFTTLVHK